MMGVSPPIAGPPKKDPEKPRVPPLCGAFPFIPAVNTTDHKALAREKPAPARRPRLVIRSPMPEYEAKHCNQCHQPLIEIENNGQRLRGCLTCNLWASSGGGRWIRLSEEDIRSLHLLRRGGLRT